MTYDESPVEVQYERCKQAMEILRNNVKDAQTMAAIDDAYKNCQENGATRVFYSWTTSYFKLYALKKRFFVNFFNF